MAQARIVSHITDPAVILAIKIILLIHHYINKRGVIELTFVRKNSQTSAFSVISSPFGVFHGLYVKTSIQSYTVTAVAFMCVFSFFFSFLLSPSLDEFFLSLKV